MGAEIWCQATPRLAEGIASLNTHSVYRTKVPYSEVMGDAGGTRSLRCQSFLPPSTINYSGQVCAAANPGCYPKRSACQLHDNFMLNNKPPNNSLPQKHTVPQYHTSNKSAIKITRFSNPLLCCLVLVLFHSLTLKGVKSGLFLDWGRLRG